MQLNESVRGSKKRTSTSAWRVIGFGRFFDTYAPLCEKTMLKKLGLTIGWQVNDGHHLFNLKIRTGLT